MNALTIPKTLARGEELIVIPRKEYEEFLRSKKPPNDKIIVKHSPSFHIPKKHEKFYDKLDKELTKSLEDMRAGNYYGPFETAEAAIGFLKSRTAAKIKK